MGVLNENAIMGSSAVSGDFEIKNSLRFDSESSSKLSRTPSSAGNRRTYTISFWFKRGIFSTSVHVYPFDANGDGDIYILNTSDKLGSQGYGSGYHTTKQHLKDMTNWYHLIIAVDTTQGTSSNRVKHYLNGSQITVWDSDSQPSQNADSDVNNTVAHTIGGKSGGNYFDGYMAEFHLIDGQQLTPSDFGEADEDYGHWKPIKYTGSHGTNGFYLDFADSSSLGNDASANSNNFTPTNISSHDQVKDSPTNNFCVMNSLDNYYAGSTFSEGNLGLFIATSAQPTNTATFGLTSGKWYWEVRQGSSGTGGGGVGYQGLLGIAGSLGDASGSALGSHADQYGFYASSGHGNLLIGGSYVSYGTLVGFTNGDIISMALDLDNNKMYWAKNGTYLNSGNPAGNSNGHAITDPSSVTAGCYFPAAGDYHSSSENYIFNFGQEGTFIGNETAGGNSDGEGIGNFKYAVPSGFKAICSANLDTDDYASVVPSAHFNTVVYTGDGGLDVTGVGFQPDLVWCKARGATYHHQLHDSVRGATAGMLKSNDTDAENSTYQFDSFDSDGFTTDSGNVTGVNGNGETQDAWNWKMNGSGSSNSNGSITATVSANTNAGQSIMTYSGASGNGTVGHGLSKAPNLVIVKTRNAADQWRVGTIQNLGGPPNFTDYFKLNASDGYSDESTTWNDTAPTSTVISVGTDSATNHPGYTHVAYCFHDVDGYSKIGFYLGNGNSDGTFVYCGFRPKWLLLKPSNYSDGWKLFDTVRGAQNGPYNQYPPGDLKPDTNAVENFSTAFNVDFLSNGFKWRATDNSVNGGYEYIYYAIAEQPFKFSNAR